MLSRLAAKKPSFAGTGLLERMRSTTFAVLGITTAMGLGLVAVVSQQDWPFLPAAPLPALTEDDSGPGDAIEAGSAAAVPPSASGAGRHRSAPPTGRRASEPQAPAPGARLSGSRQLATAPPRPLNPVGGSPASPAKPSPVVAQSPAPSPAPSSPPTAPPQVATPPSASAPSAGGSASSAPGTAVVTSSTHPGKGNAYGKQKPAAGSKGKSRGKPPAPAPAPESTTPPSTATTQESAATSPAPEMPVTTVKGAGHAYGHVKR